MQTIDIQALLDLDEARTRFLQSPSCETAGSYIQLCALSHELGMSTMFTIETMHADMVDHFCEGRIPHQSPALAYSLIYCAGVLFLETEWEVACMWVSGTPLAYDDCLRAVVMVAGIWEESRLN